MKKSYITAGVVALMAVCALPAVSVLRSNQNALGRVPRMTGEFAAPVKEELPDAKKLADDDGETPTKPRNVVARVTLADGTPLPKIVATVYDYSTATIGTYSLPEVSGGSMTKLSDVSSYYGGSRHGNVFYACHDGRYEEYWDENDPHGHKIQGYDIETWQPVGYEMNFSTYRASDMAIHPTTGKAYAFCDYSSLMYHLYELNLQTGAEVDLMPSASMFPERTSRALAFDSDGVLWGVTKDGKFGTVNLSTGVNSETFTLSGINGDLRHGMTADFDPETGNFIFIYNAKDYDGNEIATLYSINPSTGAMTPLAQFPGKSITSMYIAPDNTADGAPGEVTAASASFPGGLLNGTISFTMPTTLHDGSAASGQCTWTVSEEGTTLASGTASYGAQVEANVTVAAGGKHNFNVNASNAAGAGKKIRIPLWVGPDVPLAPASVTVDYNETAGTFAVSWSAVTAGANGGYLNPADVRYTVRRIPAGEVIAQNTVALTVTDQYTPQGIESVSYEVTASQGDLVSAPALSDPIVSGSLALPYKLSNCGAYNHLDGWSIYDVNEDGSTWEDMSDHIRYKYHNSNQADDWAITPPINAVAGSRYECKMTVYAYGYSTPSYYPERIEVKMGSVASPSGMAVQLLEPTEITAVSTAPVTIEFDMVPDFSGKMFLGLHAISDADQYYLYVKELTISAPVSTASAGAVTDLAVLADADGALSAAGSGRAPSQTVDGGALTSIDRIVIRRDGTEIASLTGVTPGQTFTFTDPQVPTEGEKEYTAVAVCGGSEGAVGVPAKTFVGINYPTSPTDIQITEGTEPSTVHVSWTAPTVDRDGYPLNGARTYAVEVYPDNAYYHGNATYNGIEGTEYTFIPQFADGRDHGFVRAKVSTVNAKGQSYAEKSGNIAVGTALTIPFGESFPNYTLQHPWGDGESNGPQIASITDDERSLAYGQYNGWNRLMDRSFNSAEGSQDGDNGFAGMFGWSYAIDAYGNYHNEYTELLSPKIALPAGSTPMLTFYTYNWLNSNGKDMNEIDVYVECDGTRNLLKHQVVGDLGNLQAWEFVAADMSAYAGKTVTLAIRGTVKANGDNGYNWVLIDNLAIKSMSETDLAVDGLEVPVVAVPGEEFEVKARVTNMGTAPVAAYRAALLKNGVEVDSKDCAALPFSSSTVLTFSNALSVNDPVGNTYQVAVEAYGDAVAGNNVTAGGVVARNLQLLPSPRNVRSSEGGNMLWDTPDIASAAPAPVTDTFEDYPGYAQTELFATEVGDWIFIDRDERPIGGIISASTYEVIEFPGIPQHSAQSWWLQNRLFEEFNNDYFGHSGVQYLANMYVVNDAHNMGMPQDDWAISPELCGQEQLISIMARSYDRYTPESLELLWSNGSLNPDDFVSARYIETLSGDWTQLVFVVPEGARRFAIRGCSAEVTGTNQTFVDDVTFVAADGEPQALTLLGYNIYRDGAKLNSAPVTTASYALGAGGVYSVSAVYDKGESRAIVIDSNVSVAETLASASVRVKDGCIVIDGITGRTYSVVAANGLNVARGVAAGTMRIPVLKGIYIVTAGDKRVKLTVN